MLTIAVLVLVACAGAIIGVYQMRREREVQIVRLIRELEQGAVPAAEPAANADKPGRFTRLLQRLNRFMPVTVLDAINEKLRWAGRPYGIDAEQFISLKLVLAVVLPTLMPLVTRFTSGTLALMLLTAVVGFVLPDVWLGARLGERRRLVQEELPLFTDLVATAVSAGLSLTEAVRRVAADAPGLVAREFLRSVQEMAAGKPRVQAWRDLMDRVPGDEFRSIVTAIMQAEQYGTSVSELLRYQVQQIRTFIRTVA